MDVPTYLQEPEAAWENFMEELIQTLRDNVSDNGFVIPSQTTANIVAIAPSMPNGTIWFCSDHIPPCWVGLNAGVLVQFTTAAFP